MKNVHVTRKSIANFDSPSVVLVTYLLLPIISLFLLLLIAYSGNQDYTRIVLGSLMNTGISTVMGIILVSFVRDQQLGVSQEIISIQPKFGTYWLPKMLLAFGIMILEVGFLMLVGLGFLGRLDLLPKFLLSFVLFGLSGILLGYISALAGRERINPYWLSNFLIGGLTIWSGVILPVEHYPLWLRLIADLFPMNQILNWIQVDTYMNHDLLLIFLKLFSWYLVALILTKVQERRRS